MDKENQPLIMAVEDYEDNRQQIFKMLSRRSYRVVGAVNGLDALNKLLNLSPDLVLKVINVINLSYLDAGYNTCLSKSINARTMPESSTATLGEISHD